MIVSCNMSLLFCVIGAIIPNWLSLLMKLITRLTRLVALKIHVVYLWQIGSREQVILEVRVEIVLLRILAWLNRSQQ